MVLLIFFGAVGVVADIFMGSIENITAKEKTVVRNGQEIRVLVWNKTVANLSLMALGSSAPEILLGIGEVVGRGFQPGALGPGTIVGSAAFNMLMILAICVAIEEPKRVKHLNVLLCTFFFSLWAYVWLYLMVKQISPDRIDVWEAVVTILHFPLFLVVSWLFDIGVLAKGTSHVVKRAKSLRRMVSASSAKRDEEMALEHLVAVGQMSVVSGNTAWNKRLRKQLKIIKRTDPHLSKEEMYIKAFEAVKGRMRSMEDLNNVKFQEGEQAISARSDSVDIENPLFDPNAEQTVNALNPGITGQFGFTSEAYQCAKNGAMVTVKLQRMSSNDVEITGSAKIMYRTVSGTAVAGKNFEERSGIFLFADYDGACERSVDIKVIDNGLFDANKFFSVQIDSVEALDWVHRVAEIEIVDSYKFNGACDWLAKQTTKFLSSLFSEEEADNAYTEQIRCAMRVDGGDEEEVEEGEEPAVGHKWSAWAVHLFLLPWKVLFSIITPPVTLWHGGPAFIFSLAYIGVCTLFIGDFATGLGCTIGLKDEVTAVIFVALGTSVPDTFASKIAAEEDPDADPAIGNVTGSNAVNVYLGIGLSWLIGAAYQTSNGSTFELNKESSGALGFAVVMFVLMGCVWFATLMIRRRSPNIGAELGGPQPYKGATSAFFVFMWVLFISLFSLAAYDIITPGF